MSKFKYEVTVTGGKYMKDGVEKTKYYRIGSVIETKNGLMLKLDNVPILEGGWSGWAYLNEPRDRDEQKNNTQPEHDDIEY
jgi:hypothetical protein